MSLAPGDLRIICFDVPERIMARALDVALLPGNWRDYPSPPELAAMGTHWVHAGESLLLRVPSAIVEHEFNILINPAHPDFKAVAISTPERFVFDRRLLGRGH
jgi:RES domain-containing protein